MRAGASFVFRIAASPSLEAPGETPVSHGSENKPSAPPVVPDTNHHRRHCDGASCTALAPESVAREEPLYKRGTRLSRSALPRQEGLSATGLVSREGVVTTQRD
jgi:hypothetical protein